MTGFLDLPATADAALADKHAMRRRIRAERAARPAAERLRLAEHLVDVAAETPQLHRVECVALYASMPGEPGTAPLRAWLRERGVRVLLPVVSSEGLRWAVDDGDLAAAPAGTPGGATPRTPAGPPEDLRLAQVVLVPALAVDTLGRRLGQGGGFYDRSLRHAHPAALVAAVVHDAELLDAAVEPVPTQPHDHLVSAALTPSRWRLLDAVVDLP
ncbi:MAG: 5-formyltetrahydrofolate cyclo-ligase [Kineosporiaceae bacterium]